MSPKKLKKRSKIISNLVSAAWLAGFSFISYTIIQGNGLREAKRQLGMIDNPYKDMGLEEVVKKVTIWEEAEQYLMAHLKYKKDNDNYGPLQIEASFEEIHKRRIDDCDGGATAAAALLSDNPRYALFRMILNMRPSLNQADDVIDYLGLPSPFRNHAVSIVHDKETMKFGALGIGALDCIKPEFDSINEVFKRLNANNLYMFGSYKLTQYDDSTLIHGKNKFKEYNDFVKEREKANPNAYNYTFIEHPKKKGHFAWFQGEIPEELVNADAGERARILDSIAIYSAESINVFLDTLGAHSFKSKGCGNPYYSNVFTMEGETHLKGIFFNRRVSHDSSGKECKGDVCYTPISKSSEDVEFRCRGDDPYVAILFERASIPEVDVEDVKTSLKF